MSDKGGDTSRVVKNPLLSASVTGLTFDDFPSAPLLLPAAPPIKHTVPSPSPPPPPPPILDLNAPETELSSASNFDTDSDAFSEINLNAPPEEESIQSIVGNFVSPLEESAANIADTSILSQAASSFSQLPTVASTVFSTFSKAIREFSPATGESDEINYNTNFTEPQTSAPTFEPFYVPNQPQQPEISAEFSQVDQAPLEPPKLYSPSEIPAIPSVPNPVGGNQNTYRLTAKRKTYAPIPGLSSNFQAAPGSNIQTSSLPPQNISPIQPSRSASSTPQALPISGGEYYSPESTVNQLTNQFQHTSFEDPTNNKKEERRGLFSLTNVVAPVWQNLSGLVGKATSSESQNVSNQFYNNDFSKGDPPVQISTAQYFHPSQGYQQDQSNSILAPSAPPLSELPKEPVQAQVVTPPLPPAPAFYPSSYSPSSIGQSAIQPISVPVQKSIEQLPQPPPSGAGNNFRLQKGTRHYRAPVGIASNIPVASNFLQSTTVSSIRTASGYQALPTNIGLFNPITQAETPQAPLAQPQLPQAASISQFSASTTAQIVQQPPVHNFGFGFVSNATSQPIESHPPPAPLLTSTPSKGPEVQATEPSIQNLFGTVSQIPSQPSVVPAEQKKEVKIKKEENITLSSPPEIDSTPSDDNTTLIASQNIEKSTIQPFENPEKLPISNPPAAVFNFSSQSETKSFPPLPPSTPTYSAGREFFTATVPVVVSQPPIAGNKAPIQVEPQKTISTQVGSQPFSLTSYFSPQSTTSLFSEVPKSDVNLNYTPAIDPKPVTESIITTATPPQSSATSYFSEQQYIHDLKNNNPAAVPILPDPISFFDSFQQQQQQQQQEIQPSDSINQSIVDDLNANFDVKSEAETSFQIQNFFNNPPPSLNQSASELNYKLVGSDLLRKTALLSQSRAISPQSNVVEPPSSACSEFSVDSSSVQNPLNLNKLTNADVPDGLDSEDLDPEIMAALISSKGSPNATYQPAVKHWFYQKKVDGKNVWTPFSFHDSALIEEHYNDEAASKVVAVEGGRYDVNINERLRLPIFWSGEATEVRRCSWFYKAVDSRYVPYEEAIANKLESEYEEACVTNEWHRKIPLPTGETVVFHGAKVLVHFLQTQAADSWGTATPTSRPRIVKRDLEDFCIEQGESNRVNHLLFMVHGIGSVCDLKFRTVEEVVDEFRNIGTQLVQSHYKNSCETGRVGRVEVLPVSWHSELHSEESGIDEKLKAITLESIPKLRNFANDTLLDVLFYTSPVFCQNIMDTVAGTMNKVYSKYCQRNPSFNGSVSLAGHSLGSLILFDLLCHQKPIESNDLQNSENPDQPITPLQIRAQTPANDRDMTSKQISYTVGPAGTGQPFISYPQLVFQPTKFFALGSPIGMFVTIRGIDRLGLEFRLPTCRGFYNIFHPYDPVAYRIEALVNPDLSTARPVLVPHHKGRKRMHLELKETMTRVGADIKQKLVDTFKNTFGTVYQLTAKKSRPDPNEIEREVDKVLEMQLKMDKEPRSRADSTSTQSDVDTCDTDLPLGMLNECKRIDYVLQEAPLEFFNEYLFALTSHVCYWESADTILFIMKEIYSALGVQPDSQVPQQSMTIERPQSSSSSPINDQSGTSGNDLSH